MKKVVLIISLLLFTSTAFAVFEYYRGRSIQTRLPEASLYVLDYVNQYINDTGIKGGPMGIAGLDENAKIPKALLPVAVLTIVSQNDEPTLTVNGNVVLWIDTNDSNAVYLVYRRGTGDQVKVELE